MKVMRVKQMCMMDWALVERLSQEIVDAKNASLKAPPPQKLATAAPEKNSTQLESRKAERINRENI